MKIEDDLKSISEEDLLKTPDPKKSKILILLVGILGVILMISYVYLSYPVYQNVHGQIESRTPTQNILRAGDITIQFNDQVLNHMYSIYDVNMETERALCLEGFFDGSIYQIDTSYEPEIFSASRTHVNHAPCSEDTIVLFHTHPHLSCIASQTDLRTLSNYQEKNEHIIMLIMCDTNRFSVYK